MPWRSITLAVAVAMPLTLAADQQPQLPKSQIPALGRPTRVTDEQPPFRFGEYFVGKWTFEWDAPDGPLGPSGTITGTTVYSASEATPESADRFFDATTTATGPAGPFTIRESIAYRVESKAAARWVDDSRGFSYLQMAPVGGDLGGYFNLYFEGAPFGYKGKTLRIKNAIRITSPLRYRNIVSVSIDGGPYVNYGTVWFEKAAGG